MSIPLFNAYGLLPSGFHLAGFAELTRRFGFNPKRRSLILGLEVVAKELETRGVFEVYVDGSFVEQKPFPNDIDAYVPAESISKLYWEIAGQQESWRMHYRVDIWPAATDMEGEGSRSHFEELFSHTTDDPPRLKGMVKLRLRG